jgi:hypothetical protein
MFDRIVEDFCHFDDFCRILSTLGRSVADGRIDAFQEARA